MRLIDERFRHHRAQYVLQCALATVSMFVILAVLTSISNAAVIAALGASTFIVFALPHTNASNPRYLIGGYVIGVVVGSGCHWLTQTVLLPGPFLSIPDLPEVVFGALAVGLSTFVMVVFNAEHPPAAGLALGFAILDEWLWETPAVVLGGILALCLVKQLLKRVMQNLL